MEGIVDEHTKNDDAVESLEPAEDNMPKIFSDEDGSLYINDEDGNRKLLLSPRTGGKLELTDRSNILFDPYEGVLNMMNSDGKIIPLISPGSGGKMELTDRLDIIKPLYGLAIYDRFRW